MPVTIRIATTGGPGVLKAETVEEQHPSAGEVWIEQDAIGVNYLDVTQRNGSVPVPLPSGLGLEAAGRVKSIGADVDNVAIGDRVAYILGPAGGYASGRLYPAKRLVRVPDTISSDDVATVLFKGITAHYLIQSTFAVGPGTTVLLYGAAGAVGQILIRWAKSLGAFVIGVVSKEASAARATSAGCDAVLVWGACDLPAEVTKLTDGRKVDVVYDGIGKPTFLASLDSLRPRGLMVSIGASAGPPDPVTVGMLNAKGSLYLTRPGLAAHATDLTEYRQRADAVFEAVLAGIIKPVAWKTFPLSEAAAAHAALESGKSKGAVLLKP
ncbi:quinone oxidoreductase [Rhizobium ruizarguesonis]|uniref:quinone oxidoreductase family protein n=1 Tax=Rhizobium ruizarguesonis TaxID=2081791 RepID=UPI001031998F|nr:quinone oxidoreductase [Rhizobium ruizarguesonis]NEH75671.1 zinc-binding dehydrogenase [Rhizobium ruizarguesonis]NEJ85497.1 zinc-binding dehydrogenase [Rhizobium ruizarguesonis]NEJ96955.1 zinc-binding dehydrogenase [Rhizobium ruizarguesonis]TAT73460.1 quinone oxidoreductase [Rhizobium ruizarguesonis]TAT74646.1 quinone oxidoreductase [Rhizobium ruizarguesonis]